MTPRSAPLSPSSKVLTRRRLPVSTMPPPSQTRRRHFLFLRALCAPVVEKSQRFACMRVCARENKFRCIAFAFARLGARRAALRWPDFSRRREPAKMRGNALHVCRTRHFFGLRDGPSAPFAVPVADSRRRRFFRVACADEGLADAARWRLARAFRSARGTVVARRRRHSVHAAARCRHRRSASQTMGTEKNIQANQCIAHIGGLFGCVLSRVDRPRTWVLQAQRRSRRGVAVPTLRARESQARGSARAARRARSARRFSRLFFACAARQRRVDRRARRAQQRRAKTCDDLRREARTRREKMRQCARRKHENQNVLCALGAFAAKKSKRISARQLRTDKVFVYFT
jgi:hypothetical protein